MLSMRFKDYIWPNNPYSCTLSVRRETAIHRFPGGGYYLEELGKGLRVLSGKGEFFGAGAYEEMKKLLAVFDEGGKGRLVHPCLLFKQAIFTELELMQEPRADYVQYRFSFCEDDSGMMLSGGVGSSSGSHGIAAGETLWDIAAAYGTTAERLLAANGWISNPNVLEAGRMVVIQ